MASLATGVVAQSISVDSQRGERLCHDETETLDDRIVTHHEHAVGGAAHVELDPVGTQLARQPEGLEGVLGGLPARAAVGKHERSGWHRRQSRSTRRRRRRMGNRFHLCARTSRSDPLPRPRNRRYRKPRGWA